MKAIIKNVLLAICVIGAPTSVYAYPFRADAKGFQNYLNQQGWSSYYQNLDYCREDKYTKGYFYCKHGFVTITNPMGVKACEIKEVRYIDKQVEHDLGKCRYK